MAELAEKYYSDLNLFACHFKGLRVHIHIIHAGGLN